MAASTRRHRGAGAHDNDERWLLTYSDMITLLMALFMVLFSISSVNISKYQTLQQSLKAAFSGSILPGGKAILQSGSESTVRHSPATAEIPAIVAPAPDVQALAQHSVTTAAKDAVAIAKAVASGSASELEQSAFVRLKAKLDAYAATHGLADQVNTSIERRGLVVRVLTDRMLFASGDATLESTGLPLLNEMANLVNVDRQHPVVVEGYTDDVPISTAQFPSNWELSTARATTVVQYLIDHSVDPNRLAAAGYADLHPTASNATAAGRQLNRRVEIVFERLDPPPSQ
jgi:chemotaxis protein MotB